MVLTRDFVGPWGQVAQCTGEYGSRAQIRSDHPNYLFPFSLYAVYTCYFPLNSAFCLQKRGFKIPIPV